MPGKVVIVKRRVGLGWSERLWLPGIAKALWTAARRFLRALRAGRVPRYPERRVDLQGAVRGMPVLVADAAGRPRCTACERCAEVCPSRCIEVEPGIGEDGHPEPRRFELDMGRCMFCGLCEEACPETAIVMSGHVELADFQRDSLRYHKESLLVPEELLRPRLAVLSGGRGAAPEALPSEAAESAATAETREVQA